MKRVFPFDWAQGRLSLRIIDLYKNTYPDRVFYHMLRAIMIWCNETITIEQFLLASARNYNIKFSLRSCNWRDRNIAFVGCILIYMQ